MVGMESQTAQFWVMWLGSFVLVYIIRYYGMGQMYKAFLGISILFSLMAILSLYKSGLRSNLFKMMTGLVYLALPIGLLLTFVLQENPHPKGLLLGLIILIWTTDSGAYLVGSKIGKSKLFPSVSPNKTWEGAIGAAISSLAVGFLLHQIFNEYSLIFWVGASIIIWLIGMYGDLVESSMKRMYHIKDTGHILPGHGGFLDRFDSFIFVIPFILVWMKMCGYILY